MSSQILVVIFVIAVSAFIMTFGCQSPTVLVPGDRGPIGMQGLPGAPSFVDLVVSNRSVFVYTPAPNTGGRKRREIESQIFLTLEGVPPEDLEVTANKYLTNVVNIAQKDSSVKRQVTEIFFDTAETFTTDGHKFDITFQFQKESSKNCKSFIDAVKKVNQEIGKLQTMTMSCQGEIY